MNDRRKAVLGLIFLAALTFFVYSFGVSGTFKTMDDDFSIVRNENIRSPRNIPKIFTSGYFGDESYYRPMVSLSYLKEYFFFRLNPVPYYLDNILLHVINAFLVFAIVWNLTSRTATGMAAALLYALHPIHWEAVSNISGRAILLAAFYCLAAFVFFLYSERKKYFAYLSLIAFALGLLSKESAGVFPLVLLSYLFFVRPKDKFTFNNLFTTCVPYAAIIGVYLWVRSTLGITKTFPWRSAGEMILGFFTFLRGVMIDFKLLVYPTGLYFDRSLRIFTNFTDPDLIATFLFFGTLAAVLWSFRKKLAGLPAFCVAWFFIELMPVSQIVSTVGVQPGYISTAEHFLYMPAIPFFILGVLFMEQVRKYVTVRHKVSPFMFRFGVVGIFLFLILMTIQYNIYSNNEIGMFERTLSINPTNTRVRDSLALAYAKRKRFDLAEKNFREILRLEPHSAHARIGLAKSLCDQGKYWEGLREYEKVKDPGNLKSLLEDNVKGTLTFLVSYYSRYVKAHPDSARGYHSLGVLYSKLSKPKKAVFCYEKAVALDPNLKDALFNLASTYRMLGERDKAIDLYERVLSIKSASGEIDRYAAAHLAEMARQADPKP